MKIIGQTAEGFLLSASRNECANIVGFYYTGADGCPRFEPGMEIAIAAMFTQLYEFKKNEKALTQIASKLRAVADVLELNDPVIEKLTAESHPAVVPDRQA